MEQLLLHLDAAYNLANWLTRNSHDAEDIVQEAYLRAFKFKSFRSFDGSDGRGWLLKIVRNTFYTWVKRNRAGAAVVEFYEEEHSLGRDATDPETILMQSADKELLKQALEELPLEFREVVILRELEGMSYKEIAHIADIPVGTVMSRLARARKRLQTVLTREADYDAGSRLWSRRKRAGCHEKRYAWPQQLNSPPDLGFNTAEYCTEA